MWLSIATVSIVTVATFVAAHAWGSRRWTGRTHELRTRLEATRVPHRPSSVDFRGLDGLPPPVRRYLRAVLTEGQPTLTAASLEHSGTFNMGTATDRWRPFTSTQRVITRPPGFAWDARIAMFPGLPARVHDAYISGDGLLQAALLGLITVADASVTPDLAEGELMRFLAEAVWYPTVFLPGHGVRWEPVDDRTAIATLADGPVVARLTFEFDDAGLVAQVRAAARGRAVGAAMVPTPWLGTFWTYAAVDGVRVPLDGEVAWLLPEGPKAYWRGHVDALRYDRAPVATPEPAQ